MLLRFLIDLGLLWGSPEGHFGGHVGLFLKRTFFKACFSDILSDSEKEVKIELPKGVDMQSDHACACFVRVGHCRLGSILGSILR